MRFVALVLGAALAVSAPAMALAQEAGAPPAAEEKGPIKAEVVVLLGSNDGTGIDPAIGKLPELGKPPFSSYNSYKLLARTSVAPSKDKDAAEKLPNDGTLTVAFKGISPPKKDGDPKRYALGISLTNADGSSALPMLQTNARPGEWLFIGGPKYKNGALVIGIRVVP